MRDTRQNQSYPELPCLTGGVQLLEVDGPVACPLHSLVLDHLLLHDGDAVWVDAGGHAVATSLAQLAPSQRTLDRIQVARAFTAHQHFSLVTQLQKQVDADTSLLVLPTMDQLYRDADDFRGDVAEDLFLHALAIVAGFATREDIPVLVTRTDTDGLGEPVENAAADVIMCEQTQFGPHFAADDFETLVYPVEDGYVQTTFAFWRHVLDARQPLYETAETPTPEVTA
jgi:hypothetical protein